MKMTMTFTFEPLQKVVLGSTEVMRKDLESLVGTDLSTLQDKTILKEGLFVLLGESLRYEVARGCLYGRGLIPYYIILYDSSRDISRAFTYAKENLDYNVEFLVFRSLAKQLISHIKYKNLH